MEDNFYSELANELIEEFEMILSSQSKIIKESLHIHIPQLKNSGKYEFGTS